MSDITLFNFENVKIRVFIDEKGEPWFVAKDVCDALGHTNARQALKDNVDSEDVSTTDVPTLGGVQKASVINEPGLYGLIMSSRLEGAKRFKRWVTAEVLPSIRKTGHYAMPAAQPMPQLKSEAESKAAIIRDTVKWMREMMPSIRPETANACTLRALAAGNLLDTKTHEELRSILPIEVEQAPMYTPTQLGEKLGGIKPTIVNKMLEARGLQKKIGRRWEPTEEGKDYAGAVSYQAEHSQHKGYQIKWNAEVLPLLQEPLAAETPKLLT